jgi:hypothetical protein
MTDGSSDGSHGVDPGRSGGRHRVAGIAPATPFKLVLVAATIAASVLVVPEVLAQPNAGTIWARPVGEPPGSENQGNEPHLPCKNINLWGDHMAPSHGTFWIAGWPPTGAGTEAYRAAWHYDHAKGGAQVLHVINVDKLIAQAVDNGDRRHPQQGFNFKLELIQSPGLSKVFWVECGYPEPAKPEPPPGGGNGNGHEPPPGTEPPEPGEPPTTHGPPGHEAPEPPGAVEPSLVDEPGGVEPPVHGPLHRPPQHHRPPHAAPPPRVTG